MKVQHFFDKQTATFTYIVTDPATQQCGVIDPVLNYDMCSGTTRTDSADQVIAYVKQHQLKVEWILETHAHAYHLTGAHYLKEQLGDKTGIGEHIPVRVMHTPGHTPACLSYIIEDAVFVGDTIFMPYVGTARTDFPGGSAEMLYRSIQKILNLPAETRIFTCHDYPPEGVEPGCLSTVAEQKAKNTMVHDGVSEAKYVAARNAKDKGKAVPQLLLPSIQVNLRSGDLGQAEDNGVHYIKIPLNQLNQ